MHKSQVFLVCVLAFLAGIIIAQLINPQFGRILFYVGFIIGIILLTLFWRYRPILVLMFVLMSAMFGIWRFQNSKEAVNQNHIANYNDQQKITWQGIVVEEPDIRQDRINLTVTATAIKVPLDKLVHGNVLVTVGRYPEYNYGDQLQITGKLETPFESEEFSYKNYLARDDIFSIARFAEVSLISTDKGNPVKAVLLSFKKSFSERLSNIVPEPQNSLLLGLLVGARRSIPEPLLEDFNTTGVTHIIAISGFNISIITRIFGAWIQRIFGIRTAFVLTGLLVFGFVIITGAAASVVRAAFMGMIVVLALNTGRASSMFNVLLATAGTMVFVNPQILLFDVGFQLSFLATAGLLAFAGTFERVFQKLPSLFEIRNTLAATLSAQVFVLPLLIYYFDRLSLVAPITNLLVLPIIPAAMLFGFLAGIAGLIWLPLAYIPAWLAWAILKYQVVVIEWFADLPKAAVAVTAFSLPAVIGYYSILAIIVLFLVTRWREEKVYEYTHAN